MNSTRDYRTRLIEHRRHQRLGCFIRVASISLSLLLSNVVMLFFPQIPVVSTIEFFALAVAVAAGMERVLRQSFGYQARKASVRYLGSDGSEAPIFPGSDFNKKVSSDEALLPDDPTAPSTPIPMEMQVAEAGILVIKQCPHCSTIVAPKADNVCPACQLQFPADRD